VNVFDRFYTHYHSRRPVNATFAGIHVWDDRLPDWSLGGLEALDDEMRALIGALSDAHPAPCAFGDYRRDRNLVDAELARAFLEIQCAENASGHGMRGNPAWWTGEAVFSIVALMIRNFAPLAERMVSATARLEALPKFVTDARVTLGARPIPVPWKAKALRDCEGAAILLTRGLECWIASEPVSPAIVQRLRTAAEHALRELERLCGWLESQPAASDAAMSCGPELFDLLLARGHMCLRSRADLLDDAQRRFGEAKNALDVMAKAAAGSWPAVQEALAADHPSPSEYLQAFERTWDECHYIATTGTNVVTWFDNPVRYTLIPEWTRDAAPYLYYLYYRSPAPYDQNWTYDYVVPALPAGREEQHLRAWNHSVIKLNHVVHHGAIGHHVQNWHAYLGARYRIGREAAVDCANRIGMFCGGTMAEGWACYATGLMDELAFLTKLERVAEQYAQVRMLGRAIVDISFHQGTFTFDEAVRFYVDRVGIEPQMARAEAVKNSMYPCTAIMYWLGTQGILDLRAARKSALGRSFQLKEFHDELLSHGSIPVPLIARLMSEDVA
jgi:hypothetical protein